VSSGPRAEELAERLAEEARYGWRRPTRLQGDNARRIHPAVDVRGDAVEVRLGQLGLDELPRRALESEPLIEGTSVPRAGRCQADVGDRGHGRIGGA
jgi:hypothetical protein